MSNVSAAWTVTKSGSPRTVQATGSKIVYNANSIATAIMIFDNTGNQLNNFFANEDEVLVQIGTQNMLVGYITNIVDKRMKNRKKELQVEVTDYIGYLAAKTAFQRDFKRTTTANSILRIIAGEIPGITVNITDLDEDSEKIKRKFAGTYVKDAWNTIITTMDADYFTDERKIFQAFKEGTRELEQSTNNTWKITDQTPEAPNEVNPDYNFPLEYGLNARDRYRNVIMTNNIKETYPNVPDLYQTQKYKDDDNGKTFSAYFQTPGGFDNWSIENTERIPATFFPSKDIFNTGITMPTVQIPVLATSTPYNILLRGIEYLADGTTRDLSNMGINILDWQFIAMFIDNKLSRSSGNYTLSLRLIDDFAGNYYERQIYNSADLADSDINPNFTFIEYDLPANLQDSESLGWTKVGSPTKINQIAIIASPATGFNADDPDGTRSYLEFGKVHMFRRRRASATTSGIPSTEKIIIDSTVQSQQDLQVYADKELVRANKISKSGHITIDGNTAFRHPAYMIDTDFSESLGSGRSGLVRMDQIIHTLTNGIHKTRIVFKPSNMQP